MNSRQLSSEIQIGGRRSLSRAEVLSLLNTYNCFLKDKTNLHLNVQEKGGEVMVEGFLVISWGVRKPIRLKIQDEKQVLQIQRSPGPVSPLGGKRGMVRWGEWDDLLHIDEMNETQQGLAEPTNYNTECQEYAGSTMKAPQMKATLEEASNLFRTMSDASLVKKRVKTRTAAERQQAKQHRFSINGHFYNYKTSIFTPSFGTPTNVRINSSMTTREVIQQLLQKFKIENDPHEFALYCIHQSGERRKLSDSDLPLWERVLNGPSESIMKMFLMDSDEMEVSNDVAQYLNLELPLLEGVLQRLKEEENREIERIITKYKQQRRLLSQCLGSKLKPKTETTV
ncbi:ras association domain-containing protein 6 [Megalops cyprinoides]|uniref:ras association domain-containing protein 6 n=1 Tax=Megalops cyprinoides TaxID=118141 RepID=UPI0018641912|nr:ras association domain-containing protein 6 [Megalops cyprinoides]